MHGFGQRLPTGFFSRGEETATSPGSPSCGATLFPTTTSTMADSDSPTTDSHAVDVGGVYTSDEAELARMGYKQELKCVQFVFYTPSSFNLYVRPPTTRRDLTLSHVR